MFKYIDLLKEIFEVISLKRRKKLILIFFLLAVSGFLETLGIGLIIPLISEILNSSTDIFSIKNFFYFKGLTQQNLIINLIILIFFVYLFKGLYLTYLEFYIQKFSQNTRTEVSLKLYKKYINNKYELNVNSNSSILYRNITTEAGNFTNGVLEPAIMAAKEFFIIGIILIFIITMVSVN